MADFWTIRFTVYRAAPQRGSDPNAIRAPFLLPILCHVKYGKDIKTLPPKPFSSTDRMVKHLKELAESLKDHEKAVFLQVFQYRITEKKERLRSTHYEEVSQTFREASKAGVEFWEVQMDFRPEGVTLYSVKRSEDL